MLRCRIGRRLAGLLQRGAGGKVGTRDQDRNYGENSHPALHRVPFWGKQSSCQPRSLPAAGWLNPSSSLPDRCMAPELRANLEDSVSSAVNVTEFDAQRVTLTDVCFEVVKRKLRILANLNQIAVWITHVATPFPAMVVERFGEKGRAFVAPLFVTGPNVRDT